jgi:uncharacterized protein
MFYNCHIHTFKEEDICRGFLPFNLVSILDSKVGYFIAKNILHYLNPFCDKDLFDRYLKFITVGKLKSQKEIFEGCRKFYPSGTKFIVLSMDMAYMGAGKVPRKYEEQLKELYELKKDFPDNIIPFVHADPRRPGITDLVIKCVEDWGFRGIKIYPNLGYFPYDDNLDSIYQYAIDKNIPVIAHASPYNPVHYKGSLKNLKILLAKAKTPLYNNSNNKKKLCSNFSHPENYRLVFEKFPDLKLGLAHFGSSYFWNKYLDEPDEKDNWFSIIKELLVLYPNLYSDISFTLYNKEYFSLLKVLLTDSAFRQKILFGSDYYMNYTETSERRFSLDLRAFLGEDNFMTIARENIENFLY